MRVALTNKWKDHCEIADVIIEEYLEHYNFTQRGAEPHMHDCIVAALEKLYEDSVALDVKVNAALGD